MEDLASGFDGMVAEQRLVRRLQAPPSSLDDSDSTSEDNEQSECSSSPTAGRKTKHASKPKKKKKADRARTLSG